MHYKHIEKVKYKIWLFISTLKILFKEIFRKKSVYQADCFYDGVTLTL